MAQLKALFEKQWESIVGNCDEFLYLRTEMNSQVISTSANSYGKETIDTNTYGKSTGHSGSYSTNYQIAGRELMTPDEVRMLDNKYAILLIRGETPIIDEKFDTFKHKNFKYTEDGGYKPYFHGSIKNAVGTLSIAEENDIKNVKEFSVDNINDYDIIVDEEIDEYFENKQ